MMQINSVSNGDGYIEVANNAAFVVRCDLQYSFNGSTFNVNTGEFLVGTSRTLNLPEGCTDIHVLVSASNGNKEWIPVYNNNFSKARILKLSVTGTTFDPECTDITNDPSFPSTTPPKYYVSAENKGAFTARYTVQYSYDGTVFNIPTSEFSVGMIRTIGLPEEGTNVYVLVEINNGSKWISIFNDNFDKAKALKLQLTGTIFDPKCTVIPVIPDVGDGTEPEMTVTKFPNVSQVHLGETVTFTVNVSNENGVQALGVILMDLIPDGANFVENSLTVDGETMMGIIFPTKGINLGNIAVESTVTVTYQLIFTSMPSVNPVATTPIINYSYISDGENKMEDLKGTVTSLQVVNCCNSCCCCCCHCPDGGNGTEPEMTIIKSPNVCHVHLGETVTFTVNVSNESGMQALNVILMDSIPDGANFVENSLTVDGQTMMGIIFPTKGIYLGNIAIGSTVTVTYQVIFTSMPSVNPVAVTPTINYSYVSNGENKMENLTGTVDSLQVVNTCNPCCCCCCHCPDGGNGTEPEMTVTKYSNVSQVYLGETVTFTVNVSNESGMQALGVILMDSIPDGANFVENSLTVNGQTMMGVILPTKGIYLGNMAMGSTATVTYQLIFSSMPSVNPVAVTPTISYRYVSNGENQMKVITGTVTSLQVVTTCNPCCCCYCTTNNGCRSYY